MNNGIERLKILAEGQEDVALNKIINYLVTLTEMNDKYLCEEKSIKQMIDYIKSEARKIAKGEYCWVEDTTVFNWSVNYWNKTNDELGIKEVATPTPTPVPASEVKKEIVPEVQTFGQLSLF